VTVEIPLTRGLVALVDDADADLLRRTSWHAIPGCYTWYASRGIQRADGRSTTQLMHKMLTGWPRTDHINGDGLDNQRANLRPATAGQNVANARKGGGSSRFKGVSWWKRSGRWQAYIMIDGHQAFLGHFDAEEDAARAYDAEARQLFGEFARLNFPGPGERSAIGDPTPRIRRTTSTSWRHERLRRKAGACD
jgi:hypothetical protein